MVAFIKMYIEGLTDIFSGENHIDCPGLHCTWFTWFSGDITFVQFQTSTLSPKFSKKLLPPAFNLTCLLTHCLLFLKFTMTSSLRWIVVRSLYSFFSTYLLPSILLIIPSFLLVFKIGSVLMVCLLIGSPLIFHFALRQSQSMIPSLHSLLFPVVYPKVPYLAHSFSLSVR